MGSTDWGACGRTLLFVVLAYGLGSQLAYTWFQANGVNASFFPAAGVTVAALVVRDTPHWPAVIVGAGLTEVVLDLSHDIELAPSVGYAIANLAQPLVAMAVLGGLRTELDITRLRHLARFVLGGVVVGPLVGGALGATTKVLLVDDTANWLRFTTEWWVGDGLGVLVVGGTILGVRTRGTSRQRTWWAESVALTATAAVATFVSFHFDWFVLIYVPLVLLFTLAVRAGIRWVAISSALVAFVAAEGTARGHLFWAQMSVANTTGLLYLQLALIVVIASALAMSAALEEREASTLAYAAATGATREAEQAQRRSELLRRLAEDLGRCTSAAEVLSALLRMNLGQAWPTRALAAPISLPTQVTIPGCSNDHHYQQLIHRARRLAGDALERVRLLAQERAARERAELLELHAAHLAAAPRIDDIAAVTADDVGALMPEVVEVWTVDGDALHRTATRGAAPRWLDTIELATSHPLAECLRRRRPIVVDSRAQVARQFPAFPHPTGCESLVLLPLLAHDGRAVGALLLAAGEPRWLSEQRRQVLLGIAEQCGLALERAQQHRSSERASADATMLSRLSERLDRATTARDRAHRAVEHLITEGTAVGATVEMIDGEERVPLASAGDVGNGNELTIPLQARGRLLGYLGVWLTARASPSETRLLYDVAMRAALALDNALLYEHERDVSHRLQLGLLDVRLPTIDGLQIDAAYRPGTQTLDVGGDWHDAFVLPSGALALVVGDVVGHGLDAAIAMAQLRGAVRALAAVSSPTELLDRLDMFVDSLPAAQMTTLVYVELHTATGHIRYACAGHPPPLVVSATGQSRYLWDGRSTPLGSHFRSERVEGVAVLDDAERLVLYTDGLIERRGEQLDVGLARLLDTTQHDVIAGDFVDRLHRVMLEQTAQRDDVCVLAVARCGSTTFTRTITPTPAHAARLRHEFGGWLGRMGVSSEDRREVLLAVSEAVSNAVEHGSAGRFERRVVVTGTVRNKMVTVVVRDHGEWREPRPCKGRGRGMGIMRTVMHEVTTEIDDCGTVVRMHRRL